MKKLLSLCVLLFVCFNLWAQCDLEYVENCKKSIDKNCVILGTYNLNFDGIEKVKTYDIGMRKQTRYRFNLYYAQGATPPVTEVLLGDEVLVSSHNKGKHFKGVDFVCSKTHSYKLRVKGDSGCVVLFVSSVDE